MQDQDQKNDKQPEALRLADDCEGIGETDGWPQLHEAAAELRRLHEENEMLWKEREEPHQAIDKYVRECNRLESERDVLLEALKDISRQLRGPIDLAQSIVQKAIAKAEGRS